MIDYYILVLSIMKPIDSFQRVWTRGTRGTPIRYNRKPHPHSRSLPKSEMRRQAFED